MSVCFGLFGGRDSDTDSDPGSAADHLEEKTGSDPRSRGSDPGGRREREDEDSNGDEQVVDSHEDKLLKSKWRGVYEEYAASSFLHHFVKDDDQPEETQQNVVEKEVNTPSQDTTGVQIPPEQTAEEEDPGDLPAATASFLTREQCAKALENTLTNQRQHMEEQLTNQRQHIEEQLTEQELAEEHRLAEIQQIEEGIQRERERWEPLYSDEESEDMETGYKPRRKRPIPTTHSMNRPVEGYQYAPGERWKRLKIMAETRVKNNPEKYSMIPKHKFPLRP